MCIRSWGHGVGCRLDQGARLLGCGLDPGGSVWGCGLVGYAR